MTARTPLPAFPMYAYRITPINELAKHAGDTKNFLDTIGVLVEVSDVYTVHLPNKPAPTLTWHILLRDLSYSEMKVPLWGQRAPVFNIDGIYNSSEAKPVIVLFVVDTKEPLPALFMFYAAERQGECMADHSLTKCRHLLPQCKHDIALVLQPCYSGGLFQHQKLEIRTVAVPAEQGGQIQVPVQHDQKTLRELNDMDMYDFVENGYRCSITVHVVCI